MFNLEYTKKEKERTKTQTQTHYSVARKKIAKFCLKNAHITSAATRLFSKNEIEYIFVFLLVHVCHIIMHAHSFVFLK
jgi:uncharacterized membrane protein